MSSRRGPAVTEPLEPRALLTVAGGGFTETVVADRLRQPTALAVGLNREDPVLIAEKNGHVRVFRNGGLLPETALSLPVDVQGGRGVLGIAVGRTFARDRYVYINYTTREGGGPHQRISRFQMAGDTIFAKSEVVLLDLPGWDGSTTGDGLTNLGGGLRVGFDGTLLVGVGDMGRKENAAALDSPFGKILRLKPTGGAPADNPFASQGGWAAYVWAYGLRDPAAPAVYVANGISVVNDAGEAKFQEINRLSAGTDYGWPAGEGPDAGAAPAYAYPNASPDQAAHAGSHIAGGVFFTPGSLSFPPPFANDYFVADRDAGTIHVMDFDRFKIGEVEVFATDLPAPVDLVATGAGDLLVVGRGMGDGDGELIRYRPNGAPAVVRHPRGGTVGAGGTFGLSVEAAGEGELTYQWQRDGVDIPGAIGASYTAGPLGIADDGARFRVIVSNDLASAFSREAVVRVTATGPGTGGTDPGTGGTPGGGPGRPTRPGGQGPFPPRKPPKPQGPFDLVPEVVGPVPGSAVGGTRGKVAVRVANFGLDVSPGPMTVQLFLSADGVPDPTDARVAELTRTVRIKPTAGKTIKLKFVWPADGLNGSYRLIAQVDPVDPVQETNRLNNAAAGGAVVVAPPFVDVRAAVGPASAAGTSVGGAVEVPVTVYNDGNLASAGDVTVVVSVVPGAELAGTSGPAAAEAVATATAVYTTTAKMKFAPRRGRTLRLRFALPADLAAGTYTLAASADTANVVAEADETNNTAVGPAAIAVG